MAKCPVCNAPVSDDFGLIECPSCSAQLIVHMDGRVEYSGAKDALTGSFSAKSKASETQGEKFDFGEAAAEIELPEETPEVSVESDKPAEFGSATEPSVDFLNEFPDPHTELAAISAFPEADVGPGAPVAQSAAEDAHGVIAEPELHATPPAEDVVAQVHDDVFAMPDSHEAEVYGTPAAPAASEPADLSDIARFGNSDLSTRDGSLRYTVFISGIDTADVREAFREAITDRKLVWDIDQILRSLKNGEVQIQNVTPPKAYILISRLRNVPVQVRWEQYALSQT